MEKKRRSTKKSIESVPSKIKRLATATKSSSKCCSCSEMKEFSQKIIGDVKNIMDILTCQTELIKTLIRQQTDVNVVRSSFPIPDEDDLKILDGKISEENKTIYMETIKELIGGRTKKKLLAILDGTIIMNFNINGTHGKKSLKKYSNFYEVLKDAFASAQFTDPEDAIRKELLKVKRQHFHSQFVKRKAIEKIMCRQQAY